MKALLINGSPHRRGCTYTALGAVEAGLQEQGIDADIMWIGTGAISGCLGCGKCLNSSTTLRATTRSFSGRRCILPARRARSRRLWIVRSMAGAICSLASPLLLLPVVAEGAQRQPSTSSISISPFRTWWLLALSIGIKFMETRPRRSCTTKRACRPCVRSAAIWRGL